MIDPVCFRPVSGEQQLVSRHLDEQPVAVEPDRATAFGDP